MERQHLPYLFRSFSCGRLLILDAARVCNFPAEHEHARVSGQTAQVRVAFSDDQLTIFILLRHLIKMLRIAFGFRVQARALAVRGMRYSTAATGEGEC